MRILYLTEDHSLANYGVTTVLSQLADALAVNSSGFNIHIVTTGATAVPQAGEIKVSLFPMATWAKAWGWSPGLYGKLSELMDEYKPDLVHIHGIWFALPLFGLRLALRKKIPVLITAHGMLSPWFWNEKNLKKYKKSLYFRGVFIHVLPSSAVIHAITPLEKEHLSAWFPKQQIAVIPNAISIKDEYLREAKPENLILFIGRLHPVKGVELLIHAFHRANLGKEWRLVIAGPECVPGYFQALKEDAARLGVSQQVEFIGQIFGDKKLDLMRKAWVAVVPSYSEVVGMVNLEAAACSVPTITTYPTGLWDWQDGGGLLINPDVDELTHGLIQACGWSMEERRERGRRSRQLVVEKYSWDAVIPQWEKLYHSLGRKTGG